MMTITVSYSYGGRQPLFEQAMTTDTFQFSSRHDAKARRGETFDARAAPSHPAFMRVGTGACVL